MKEQNELKKKFRGNEEQNFQIILNSVGDGNVLKQQYEQKLKAINKDLKEKENIYNNLEKQNGELQNNITNLGKKRDNLFKEISEYEKKLSTQKNIVKNINNLNKQIGDLTNKYKQNKEELKNTIKIINSELADVKSQNEKLLLEKNKKDKEINELNQQNDEIKTKIKMNSIQKKEKEISKKMKELEEKEKNIANLPEKYGDLDNFKEVLIKKISELEKKNEKLKTELEKNGEELPKKKEEIKTINNYNKIKNKIIIVNEKRPNSAQTKNLIFQNNKIAQPVNYLTKSVNQQGLFDNEIKSISQDSNNESSLLNSPFSISLKDIDVISPNQKQNKQDVNSTSKPPLLKKDNSYNPLATFVTNIIPPARKINGVIAKYNKPTLIGLNNIGSTCYKNSVLQC